MEAEFEEGLEVCSEFWTKALLTPATYKEGQMDAATKKVEVSFEGIGID